MVTKEIKASLTFTLMFGEFSIHIKNTHNNKLLYDVYEKNGKSWVEVPNASAEYILKDFRKTEAFKKIVEQYNTILKEYGS